MYREMKFIILEVSILFFVACAVVLMFVCFQRYNLPYNEAGRYFDGVVVLEQETVLVLAILAISSLIIAGVLSLIHLRIRRHRT